jgi:hypothetical protein
MRFRALVLGGYGLFGSRIARGLAATGRIAVCVAGRDAARARAFADALGPAACGIGLDVADPALTERIAAIAPQLVIHAAGPFQGRDYREAWAAVENGAHYLDLADDRTFVSGIGRLDAAAREHGVLVVSGASTVPAISSAVIDAHAARFGVVRVVDIGISPGNLTPRGLATVAAILNRVGQPFLWREDGVPRAVHGWQRLARQRFPAPVGVRWLAACDVPDLELFPQRYPSLVSLRFRAGLELRTLHFGLWLLSWLARWRIVANWARHAVGLERLSEVLARCGSDAGAMHVTLRGCDPHGRPLTLRWDLVAADGDGPQVPCTPVLVLAGKLADGSLRERGARPCMGMLRLAELEAAWRPFAIRTLLR